MERKKVILFILLAMAAYIAIFLPKYSELQKLRESNDDIKQRIRLLEQNNDILKEEIKRLKDDPFYLEKKAREKLGIIKKGEYIYKEKETEE